MTQQHEPEPTRESVIIVHHAANAAEAAVLRGVLQSAGIKSPSDTFTDPFPMQEPPAGFQGTEILVLASQEADARKIIEDFYRESSGTGQRSELK